MPSSTPGCSTRQLRRVASPTVLRRDNRDGVLLAGIDAQRSGDMDLHAGTCSSIDSSSFFLQMFAIDFESLRFPVPCPLHSSRQAGKEFVRLRRAPCSTAVMTYEQPSQWASAKIGTRPLCRMVRVRVIKADNVPGRRLASPALDLHQLLRRNIVAVMRGIGARIPRPHRLDWTVLTTHSSSPVSDRPSKHAATLMGIGLFSMGPQRRVRLLRSALSIDSSIPPRTVHSGICPPSRTRLSQSRYLDPPSPRLASPLSSARRSAAVTLAAADTPTRTPSSRPSRLAIE